MNDRGRPTELHPNYPITNAQVIVWLEFGGWTTLVLIPMLQLVNGPAVSRDQFVVRCGLIAVAIILGPGFTVARKVRTTRTGNR
jgi:hypothetical protein